jgi:hypothetical protein
VQAPVLEVAQPRCDTLSSQCEQAEDMIAGAAGVDVMLIDFDSALMPVDVAARNDERPDAQSRAFSDANY